MGRVVTGSRKTNGVTKTVFYAYNLDGTLKTLTYPSGRVMNYQVGRAKLPLSRVAQTSLRDVCEAINSDPPKSIVCDAQRVASSAEFRVMKLCGFYLRMARLKAAELQNNSALLAPERLRRGKTFLFSRPFKLRESHRLQSGGSGGTLLAGFQLIVEIPA